jgi:hypothetical protein
MHFGGPISYLFFVTFIFLLCVEILPKKAAILATLAATVLTAYYYLQVLPFGMSAVFIPLILFLYFKYRKRAFAPVLIIVLILIVLLVFYHPFTSLVLAGILFIMELANPIFNKLFGRHEKQNYFYVKADRLTLNLLVISLAVLTLWLLGNYLFWSHTITNSFNWLTGEITRTNLLDRSMIGYGIEGIYKLGLRSYDIIELFIKLDGHLLIYLLVALTTFILLLRKRLPITSEESRSIFLLSIALGIFTLIGIANYFIALTILNSGSRLLQYIYPLLFPVVGLGLYKIIITGELRRGHISIIIRGFVIFTIIAVSSLICIYSIFPSPTIYDRNQEVSYKEWFGISWFLKTRNIGLEYIDIASAITPAFATALYGPLNASYPTAMPVWVGNHFNYGNNQNLGDSLTEDKYLILDNYVKLYYTEVDLTGRFNSDDFIRLESDDSVNLIYANGDVEWYYVYGLEKP